MFQVASNFNCLEVPGVSTDPERGDFVTNLMVDATQGPAASGGAAAAAITRAHAAFYDPSTAPADWGQTLVSGDRPPPCRLAFHNIPQTLPTCTVLGSWLWVRYRVGYIFTRDVCVCVCASHGHCHGHCAVCVVVVCVSIVKLSCLVTRPWCRTFRFAMANYSPTPLGMRTPGALPSGTLSEKRFRRRGVPREMAHARGPLATTFIPSISHR